jgi:Raf kinase inhibitor-like YbhB/YbcL family protein
MTGDPNAGANAMTIVSPQITSGGIIADEQVFNSFGCTGGNISPELSWTNAPEGTKSFALMFYDPDAPTGSGWWHWVVFNIPATVTKLAKGAGTADGALMPAGSVQSRTDFGEVGYGGPCPPEGDAPHRYQFMVFALSVEKLSLEADAPAAMVGFYIHANLLAKALVEAKYGR